MGTTAMKTDDPSRERCATWLESRGALERRLGLEDGAASLLATAGELPPEQASTAWDRVKPLIAESLRLALAAEAAATACRREPAAPDEDAPASHRGCGVFASLGDRQARRTDLAETDTSERPDVVRNAPAHLTAEIAKVCDDLISHSRTWAGHFRWLASVATPAEPAAGAPPAAKEPAAGRPVKPSPEPMARPAPRPAARPPVVPLAKRKITPILAWLEAREARKRALRSLGR